MALINTLQLAARKNLIQMSSDVIIYNNNCHSGLWRHFPSTCLDFFVFPYLKNNVFKNRPGTIPELMQVITDNCNLIDVLLCEGHLKTWSEESSMFGSWRQTFRTFTLVPKYDWSSSWFFYNRQVTHNAHLYENQDYNVLKITNLTSDNWNFNELPTEIFGHSQL
jgi:hypothetical protein